MVLGPCAEYIVHNRLPEGAEEMTGNAMGSHS